MTALPALKHSTKTPDHSMDTSFIPYQHGQKPYTSRRTKDEWESWRPLIKSWHNEGLSRQQMCGLLFEQGFIVNHSQLVRKMGKWNMLVRDKSEQSPQSSTSSDNAATAVSSNSNFLPTHIDIRANDADDHNQNEAIPGRPGTGSPIDQHLDYYGGADHALATDTAHNFPPTTVCSFAMSSNLSGADARTRVLRKMEAAQSGMPEASCCCDEFFSAKEHFRRWQPLYHMLMEESEPLRSLHFARALAHLCRGSVPSEAMTSRLEHTLNYYKGLLARPKVKNDAAYAIAVELAGIHDDMLGEQDKLVMRVAIELGLNHADPYRSESKKVLDTYSHLYDVRSLSLPSLKSSEDNRSDWIDCRNEQRQSMDDRLSQRARADWLRRTIQDCRDVILNLRNLAAISEYASTLRPWSYLEGHIHARATIERTNTIKLAQHISEALISVANQIAWPDDWVHSAELTSLLLDAISLIVAQEFHERGRLSGLPNDDIPARLVDATAMLDVAGTSTPSAGTVHINQKILKAIWICDPQQPLFAPQGLHLGPCRAKKCWDLLSQSVKQFDRSTSLVAPTAIPRQLEPQTPDDVSMISSSTKSSFQRFRRLHDRLKRQGSTLTAASVLSKWSGNMSVDSSTPERMLGVGSDLSGPILPLEEHRQLDDKAFKVIQSISIRVG